ncbi:hypothetical protein A3Q56_03126 [Intoshia linei]|uniref:Uncharacterized protein n=1 Tax=Intoshia linei TaxID=1819745 RepID=A0A177B6C5_9BILA|nr:hypothetical protein A3Q56_03126 [Intoshia linei]
MFKAHIIKFGLIKLEKESFNEEKKKLIDCNCPLFVEVAMFKIPNNASKMSLKLTNELYTENTDVCIFISSKKDRKNKNYSSELISKLKIILKKDKIKGNFTFITSDQLYREYKTYELRRKLANSYDLYFVDRYLGNEIYQYIGKYFATGHSSVPIAMKSHSIAQKIQNIKAFTKILDKIPGGHTNVNCINIKYPYGKSERIYKSDFPKNGINFEYKLQDEYLFESMEIDTVKNAKISMKSDLSIEKKFN